LKIIQYLLTGFVALVVVGCGRSVSDIPPAGSEIARVSPAPHGLAAQQGEQAPPGLSTLAIFAGSTGQALNWTQLLEAMDAADVVVIGESHTDASGHAIQAEIIAAASRRYDELTLSLEEFDRSQQAALDAFRRGELTATDIQSVGIFVMPEFRNNWMEWSFPKIAAAQDAGTPLVASNAPLRYSRLVRNVGCDNLPELEAEESALFDCPEAPEDPAYKARFTENIKRAISSNKSQGLKPLKAEQTDKMFRAQRVWDATMAASIVHARANGAEKVLHIVGNVHADFNGGLIQELNYRDPDILVQVISLVAKRSSTLLDTDRSRADIVIYTRN